MSAAIAAKIALKLLEQMANKKGESGGVSPVAIALLSLLCALLLIVSSIFYVATSPVGYGGAIGEFQHQVLLLLPKGNQSVVGAAGGLTEAEIDSLTADIADPARRAVVAAGLSLVGRVPYFWGGKPSAPGWDSEWNKLRLVTAGGADSSGSYRPYGLDCGGFVRWAYWTGLGTAPAEQGSSTLWWVSDPITATELLPGDLVFKDRPSEKIGHVGIYFGKSDTGENLYLHCSSSGGVVLNDWAGFIFYRRLPLIDEIEMEEPNETALLSGAAG